MDCSHFADNVTNVIVEAVELLYDLIGLAVGMVVTQSVGRIIKRLAILWVTSSGRRNDLDVGICGLDRVVEHWETIFAVRLPATGVASKPVFVADLDVVEGKRLGMSELSATLAPGRVGWSTDKFDLIDGVIYEGLEVFLGCGVAVQRESGPDGKN
jgi:hypothetical protein